jgi:hypothetical protein
VTLADVGPGWTEYRKAARATGVVKGDCAVVPGGPLTRIVSTDSLQAGAQLQLAGRSVFIYGTSAVFPDAPTAQAYTGIRNSPAYRECARKQYETGQQSTNKALQVHTAATTAAGVGTGGLEGYTSYEVGLATLDGSFSPNGDFTVYVYRHGRTVFTVEVDAAASTTAAADTTAASNALTSAVTAVWARLERG